MRRSTRRPYVVATAMLVGLAVVSWFAFQPGLPFSSPYRLDAVFSSSNGLRAGSPVRVAGVDVGKVAKIRKGPGATTIVTLEIGDRGRPVHADAVARIRPRVFLEGGFRVELAPGTPDAPELVAGGVIPLTQTTVPVQMHQALTMFDAPARESLRRTLDTLAYGFDGGGAEGLRDVAPELAPVLRDTAIVARAAQGTERHDLSRLVKATATVAAALDQGDGRVGDLVDNLAVVAGAVDSRSAQLAATVESLEETLHEAPGPVRALEAALPALERAAGHLEPAFAIAPAALRDASAALADMGRLVAPGRRSRTLSALGTAFRDLPATVRRLAQVLPASKPLTDCLSSHIVPLLSATVPADDNGQPQPVWQEFAHLLVGLAGASQNFDGNGHNLRYQVAVGPGTLSKAAVPGLGTLLATAPSTLRSQPLPPADRRLPPLVADQPCSAQPQPQLGTPSGSSGLRAIGDDAP